MRFPKQSSFWKSGHSRPSYGPGQIAVYDHGIIIFRSVLTLLSISCTSHIIQDSKVSIKKLSFRNEPIIFTHLQKYLRLNQTDDGSCLLMLDGPKAVQYRCLNHAAGDSEIFFLIPEFVDSLHVEECSVAMNRQRAPHLLKKAFLKAFVHRLDHVIWWSAPSQPAQIAIP